MSPEWILAVVLVMLLGSVSYTSRWSDDDSLSRQKKKRIAFWVRNVALVYLVGQALWTESTRTPQQVVFAYDEQGHVLRSSRYGQIWCWTRCGLLPTQRVLEDAPQRERWNVPVIEIYDLDRFVRAAQAFGPVHRHQLASGDRVSGEWLVNELVLYRLYGVDSRQSALAYGVMNPYDPSERRRVTVRIKELLNLTLSPIGVRVIDVQWVLDGARSF